MRVSGGVGAARGEMRGGEPRASVRMATSGLTVVDVPQLSAISVAYGSGSPTVKKRRVTVWPAEAALAYGEGGVTAVGATAVGEGAGRGAGVRGCGGVEGGDEGWSARSLYQYGHIEVDGSGCLAGVCRLGGRRVGLAYGQEATGDGFPCQGGVGRRGGGGEGGGGDVGSASGGRLPVLRAAAQHLVVARPRAAVRRHAVARRKRGGSGGREVDQERQGPC